MRLSVPKVTDVALDGATARLIAMAKASKNCNALPTESARTLVAFATAVRDFVLAREIEAATSVCDEIDKLVATHEDESFVAMVGRHTSAVRKALRPNGKDG